MMRSARGCARTIYLGPNRERSPLAATPNPAAPAAESFRNSRRETRRHRFSESRTHFSAFSSLTRSPPPRTRCGAFRRRSDTDTDRGVFGCKYRVGRAGNAMQAKVVPPAGFEPPLPALKGGVLGAAHGPPQSTG